MSVIYFLIIDNNIDFNYVCYIYISNFFVIITKYFILLLLQNNIVFVDKYLPTASKQFVPIEYYCLRLQNYLYSLTSIA